MKRRKAKADGPDAYVDALTGWRREAVVRLRGAVRGAGALDEVVKWGHLVYQASGPVLLIRAEEERVLLGFWRGKRLTALEPRLVPGGKHEMATMVVKEGTTLGAATLRRLAREAVALNLRLGDPTLAARRAGAKRATAPKRSTAPKAPGRRRRGSSGSGRRRPPTG
jgi:hypothetical protein